MVYNTRVMLSSAKKDSVPTTQKSCVVYEFSCRCEARYVGRTTQRLADIRKKSSTVREQPPRMCKNISSKINCESAAGQHLITNPECAKTYTDDSFRIVALQKKAVRAIAFETHNAASSPIFLALELLKLQDLFELKLLSLSTSL